MPPALLLHSAVVRGPKFIQNAFFASRVYKIHHHVFHKTDSTPNWKFQCQLHTQRHLINWQLKNFARPGVNILANVILPKYASLNFAAVSWYYLVLPYCSIATFLHYSGFHTLNPGLGLSSDPRLFELDVRSGGSGCMNSSGIFIILISSSIH